MVSPFDTAVFLAETLDVLRDINKIKLKYIRTNLHYFVIQEVNPLALPDKILLLVAIALDFWWNYIRKRYPRIASYSFASIMNVLQNVKKGKVKV